MQVVVRDNNVDQALRALKKKLQREGVFREMKLRNYYEKPSEKKARQKAEAVRRARKLARKRAQREGGLPAPAAAGAAPPVRLVRSASKMPPPLGRRFCHRVPVHYDCPPGPPERVKSKPTTLRDTTMKQAYSLPPRIAAMALSPSAPPRPTLPPASRSAC